VDVEAILRALAFNAPGREAPRRATDRPFVALVKGVRE